MSVKFGSVRFGLLGIALGAALTFASAVQAAPGGLAAGKSNIAPLTTQVRHGSHGFGGGFGGFGGHGHAFGGAGRGFYGSGFGGRAYGGGFGRGFYGGGLRYSGFYGHHRRHFGGYPFVGYGYYPSYAPYYYDDYSYGDECYWSPRLQARVCEGY